MFAIRKPTPQPRSSAWDPQIVAALINFMMQILVELYLGYEAVMRIIESQPIEAGWR